MLLLAANLRPAFTSVGPVLEDIRFDLGLSSTAAALLTGLPVLCLGLLAPVAPFLSRRLGVEWTIVAALGALALGLVLRPFGGFTGLVAGTVVVGGAVAVGNVLLPVIVKRDFPGDPGRMTSLYTSAMAIAASLAAATAVPLATTGLGWRSALAAWAIPAGLAVVAWVPWARRSAGSRAVTLAAGLSRRLLKDLLAWQVTLFLGFQSLIFYSVIAWLPTIYRDLGMPGSEAGLLVALIPLAGILGGLTVPPIAARARDQRLAAFGVAAATAVGLLALAIAPMAAPLLWVGVVAVSQGAGFPLSLTLVVLRTRTADDTQALSAMAQTIGYGLAALGPLLAGAIHDATGGWAAPIGLLVALTMAMATIGLWAGRARYVGHDAG